MTNSALFVRVQGDSIPQLGLKRLTGRKLQKSRMGRSGWSAEGFRSLGYWERHQLQGGVPPTLIPQFIPQDL